MSIYTKYVLCKMPGQNVEENNESHSDPGM